MDSAKKTNCQFSEGWVRAFARHYKLAPRETELLHLLMAGRIETAELALLMDIQPATIKKLFSRIFLRTGTTSRTALVLAVLRHHYGTDSQHEEDS